MKHPVITLIAACICGFTAAMSCSVKPEGGRTVLFESGNKDSIPYRIPAIAALPDGSLLALTDYRHCRLDIGFGRVDIHARRSPDSGRSWGGETVVIEGSGTEGATDCGFGDPAIVADRESGEILVMLVCGQTVYWKAETNRKNPNRIACIRSSDGGKTWSDWEEKTEDIYSLFDECRDGCVESCFIGSGRIFQSRQVKAGSHYRIYAAMCARPNGNRVIYSDDLGQTWKALGGADQLPALYGNEPKCEELPDGRVLLSSRAEGGRIFNIFDFTDIVSGEGTWGKPAFSCAENNGCAALENSCNGEILIIPAVRKADKAEVLIALQSVPLGPGRTNVGIYYREIPEDVQGITPKSFASGWSTPYQVSADESAYSTMVPLKNGSIGFYFEETLKDSGTGYDMVYTELSLETITGGLYGPARR